MGEVGGVDEVDVVHALGDELKVDLPQPLHGHRFTEAVVGKLEVLAEAALQAASGEEHRARAPRAGDHRLLVEVRRGPGDARLDAHAAAARAGFAPERPAPAGTEIADQFVHALTYAPV